eukprot:2374125-Alexandrium_andersonii.AAC.1
MGPLPPAPASGTAPRPLAAAARCQASRSGFALGAAPATARGRPLGKSQEAPPRSLPWPQR